MKIYTKDANRTASAIAKMIDESYGNFSEYVSEAAYKWLNWNAGSLAHLVEDLLEEKTGNCYYVTINRYKEYGEFRMYVEWEETNTDY